MKRKIAVFTGNRAEYGLLYSIIKEINEHPELELQLFVSGAHLDPAFGGSIKNINAAGFKIAEEIRIDLANDDLFSTSMAIGFGIQEIAKALRKHKPDILIVYADRFEGFAAVIAGTQMRIPVAHIEGGDITEGGALDDSVRHAMTKLAHLHFTTNADAYKNVIQMGEEQWRVTNSGLPSLDGIYKGEFATEEDLIKRYSLDLLKPVIVFTQHSVTTQFDKAEEQINISLRVIAKMLEDGVQVFITYPNNDAGGKIIINKIIDFQNNLKKYKTLFVIPSLGAFNYHGILNLAKNINNKIVCVGNSSSGIKETPVFGCPTVNIGSRQEGRLRAENVVDVACKEEDIFIAIKKCIHDENFRSICHSVKNPYGEGRSAKHIVARLLNVELGEKLITKKNIFSK